MTPSDAAESFAEAPGDPGTRPDQARTPAQACTPSNRISETWKFHDFHDLVLHHTYTHTYTVTSKNLGLCATSV